MSKKGKRAEIALEQIRNIGFAAHIDAGKTTTTERILFYTGKVHRIGEVDDGTTTTDYLPQERERGITINSAVVSCEWKDCMINIIDTPGHVDFTVEVERSLRILDGLIVIFCAVGGVQPQSETVWRQADRYNIPRIAYINKMDRTGADFYSVIEKMRRRFGNKVMPLQVPVGYENTFEGIVDLISLKAYKYIDEIGSEIQEIPIPSDLELKARAMREELLETTVEGQDELLAKYLNEEEITPEELIGAIRRSTIKNNIIPVFCGSSLKNKGVQFLMDAIVSYLPSPLDIPDISGINPKNGVLQTIKPLPEGSLVALAYKIVADSFVDKLTFIRVYSGILETGKSLLNINKDCKERVNRIFRLQADNRQEMQSVTAGDLAAVVGLRNTTTGDTLCDINHRIILNSIQVPEAVIYVAIEPKTVQDEEKLSLSLKKISEEDPSFKVKIDEETGQTIISGMGELHLEIIVDRLLRDFKVEANVGKPQVSYKVAITEVVECAGQYAQQVGGKGQYGRVVIRFSPLNRGKGFEFENLLSPEVIPKQFIPYIKKGLHLSIEAGIWGFPVIDIKCSLIDAEYSVGDSTEIAYQAAASIATQDGLLKASPILMEPIMKVEVLAGEENIGDIIGDFGSRRGKIEGIEQLSGDAKAVKSMVPLSEMFGYSTALRSKTQGRGTYTMEFHHYDEVPSDISNKIISRGY
ncbi:MAG TPA: elongation factor G [Candidatus Eremiobacteraeota bacterium]|nr:MAG: Elongation factor G [bacterium ADurb.Bin363]HPZ10090.1 elongation factor G [Candidatus Eremiobacteraeota bacterium]